MVNNTSSLHNKFKKMSINVLDMKPNTVLPQLTPDIPRAPQGFPPSTTVVPNDTLVGNPIKSILHFISPKNATLIPFSTLEKLDKGCIKHYNGPSYQAMHHMTLVFTCISIKKIQFTASHAGILVNVTENKLETTIVHTTVALSFIASYGPRILSSPHRTKLHIFNIEQPANRLSFEPSTYSDDLTINQHNIVYKKDSFFKQSIKIINPSYYFNISITYRNPYKFTFNPSYSEFSKYTTNFHVIGPFKSIARIKPYNDKCGISCNNKKHSNRYEPMQPQTFNMLSTWKKTKYALQATETYHNSLEYLHLRVDSNRQKVDKPWDNYCLTIHYSENPIHIHVNDFICNLSDYLQTSIVEYVRNSGCHISHYRLQLEFFTNPNYSVTLNSTESGLTFIWKKSNPSSSNNAHTLNTFQCKTVTMEVLHHLPLNKKINLLNKEIVTNRVIRILEIDNIPINFKRITIPEFTCPWTSARHYIFDLQPNTNVLYFLQNHSLKFHFPTPTPQATPPNPYARFNSPYQYTPKGTCATKSILSISTTPTKEIKILHIDQINNNQSSLLLIQDFPVKEQSSAKIFSEIIIFDEKVNQETVGLWDSGADASLIHSNMLHRLFSKAYIDRNLIKNTTSLSSFTNDSIQTLGTIILKVKFHRYHSSTPFPFVVYSGDLAYSILLGKDIMAKFRITLSFTYKHEPALSMNKDQLKCLSVSPEALNTGHAKISLTPKQSKICYFKINPAFTCLSTEKLLIEEQENDHILIPAALSPKLPNNTVAILIINKTKKSFSKNIQINLSTISKSHKIYNKNNLPNSETISVYKPIIQNSVNAFLPTITINEIRKTNTNDFLFDGHLSHHNNKTSINTPVPQEPTFGNNDQVAIHNPDIATPIAPTSSEKNSKKINISEVEQNMADNKFLPLGYEVPDIEEIQSLIDLPSYPKMVQPHIKHLFIEKYPTLWSSHAYDTGNLSLTLGHCSLRLKKDVTLPPFKKLYFVQDEQRQHLADVLSFLLKNKIIERANQHHDGEFNLWASPGYLVRKANPERSGYRLVLDFTFLNSQLITSPPIIPNISQMIENLRDRYVFSTYDLTNAFFSVDLDHKSQLLTRFATTEGSFIFKKLSMGLKSSPHYFCTLAHNMIHCTPVRDKNGNVIMQSKNMVELKEDKLENVTIYFDDLIISTPYNQSYRQTITDHFKKTDELFSRLKFHSAKLSPQKAVIAQTTIKFLGWIISNNFMIPDKKRVQKLLDSPFPITKTGIRAFCGLLQTLKSVIPGQYLEHVKILSPLTSPIVPYKPTKIHFEAFERLKKYLSETPLFCKLINPLAKMWLFTDACTGRGSHYGAVLVQEKKHNSTYVPEGLNMEDSVHEYIHKNNLDYEPLPIYFNDTYIAPTKCDDSAFSPILDLSYLRDEKFGLGDHFNNSLFVSLRSIFHHYKCQFFDELQLKTEAVAHLKKSLNFYKLKSEVFHGNLDKTRNFLNSFIHDNIQPDPNLLIVESIAAILKRKFVIIFPSKIVYFNDSNKPPIILGVYINNLGMAFRPFRSSTTNSFDLGKLRNKCEITYFYSKMIPEADKNKEILSLEALGLLNALTTLRPIVKIANLVAITDSKPLFLLFDRSIHNVHSKIGRYALRICQEFPDLKLRFIKSKDNLSDFLSRSCKLERQDTARLPLKFYDLLPTYTEVIKHDHEYSLDEWKDLVEKNSHLVINKQSINIITGHNKVHAKMSYLNQLLYDRSNTANIIAEQESEFKTQIELCKKAVDFEIPHSENSKLKLINGMLFRVHDDSLQILLPESLHSPIICLTHLSLDHIGLEKLLVTLKVYYIKNLNSLLRKYLAVCFTCFLNNHNKGSKFGLMPLPTHAGSTISLDLAENIGNVGGYNHILIGTCLLTNFLFAWPLRNKRTTGLLRPLLFYLFQQFHVRHILADNGPCFKHHLFATTLANLNIQRIRIPAYSPYKNGSCEKSVYLAKNKLQKFLMSEDNNNWVARLPYLVKAYNSTKNPVTGYSPLESLYGETSANGVSTFINVNNLAASAPVVSNTELVEDIKNINAQVHKLKKEFQQKQINRKNKHRIEYKYAENDYIFIINYEKTKGVPTPLRAKYAQDIYVVDTIYKKSLVARRLADNHTVLVSHNQAKRFDKSLVAQLNIPAEIAPLYLKKLGDLTRADLRHIAANSEMTIIDPPTAELIQDLPHYEFLDELEENERLTSSAPQKQVTFDNLPPIPEEEPSPQPKRRTRSSNDSTPHVSL